VVSQWSKSPTNQIRMVTFAPRLTGTCAEPRYTIGRKVIGSWLRELCYVCFSIVS
jgi:hypothetical protein